MSQVKKQPIVQEAQESAKKQVSEVARVGQDAVSSLAWTYPIWVGVVSTTMPASSHHGLTLLTLHISRGSSTPSLVSTPQAIPHQYLPQSDSPEPYLDPTQIRNS